MMESRGCQTFLVKGHVVDISGFVVHTVLVAQKQPQVRHKHMGMATFQ